MAWGGRSLALSERVCKAPLTLAFPPPRWTRLMPAEPPAEGAMSSGSGRRHALDAGSSVGRGPEAGDREFGESRVWAGHGLWDWPGWSGPAREPGRQLGFGAEGGGLELEWKGGSAPSAGTHEPAQRGWPRVVGAPACPGF